MTSNQQYWPLGKMIKAETHAKLSSIEETP